MTALRPEHDGSAYGEYDAQDAYAYGDAGMFRDAPPLDAVAPDAGPSQAAAYGDAAQFAAGAYGDVGTFAAAVERLADPLNDPLPGQPSEAAPHQGHDAHHDHDAHRAAGPHQVHDAHQQLDPYQAQRQGQGQPQPERAAPPGPPDEWFRPQPPPHTQVPSPQHHESPRPRRPYRPQEGPQAPRQASYRAVPDDATVGLRTSDTRRLVDEAGTGDAAGHEPGTTAKTAGGTAAAASAGGGAKAAGAAAGAGAAAAAGALAAAAVGGRAARRRAAKQRGGGGGRRRAGGRQQDTGAGGRPAARLQESSGGGHRAGGRRAGRAAHDGTAEGGVEPEGTEGSGSGEASPPLSRLEARRAARAAKPGAGVLASRLIGEFFISVGVLMLLFVTYQLWWTNVRAHAQADGAAHHLQDDWAQGKGKPGVFAPGQGFAIMHIPKLDVVVPIAEGTNKQKVLDRGMLGHYGGPDDLQTAMPDAPTGNFAVAGHRNTHGEPFRYVNRLVKGDRIVVETQNTYFVYMVTSLLPQTPPSNIGVIGPVPPQSGFTEPGRYITLTTCTPEFTSKYRLIVWGKMVEERPRSKGKPKALVE